MHYYYYYYYFFLFSDAQVKIKPSIWCYGCKPEQFPKQYNVGLAVSILKSYLKMYLCCMALRLYYCSAVIISYCLFVFFFHLKNNDCSSCKNVL